MLHFLNYLLGYVYIEVRGAYPERFLNLLAHDSIVFWDMTRPEIDVLRIRVAASDYKRMRICARRAMCHMHILSKNGLPFFAHKYKRRGALVAGLVLFCAIAWVMSSFVWIIDIKGDGVDAAQIRDELKQNGVYIGARRSKINVNELKNDMLLRMPDLSYIALNLDGSRAEVIARKRTKPPKIEAVDTPSNIIAKRAGVISSVVVTSGMPEVSVGDAVMPGDLLAGGYMTGRHGTTVMMRSVGTIRAKTLHTIAAKYPMDTLVKNYSGKRCTRRTLIFGHNRINLFFSTGNPYVKCDKMIKSVYLTLPGNIVLPLALETAEIIEYTQRAITLPDTRVYEYIAARLNGYINLDPDAKILKKQLSKTIVSGAACVTLVSECDENIGEEQIIPKGE